MPVPQTKPWEDGHRGAWGAFWRAQWATPFPMDAACLRLVVEGVEGEEPDVLVELDFHPDWTAVHRLVRDRGTWVAATDIRFEPRRPDVQASAPTARERRRANLDRHRHRIDTLLREAVALDTALNGDLLRLLSDWSVSAPRSRRGRQRHVDPDELDRLLSSGMKPKEVAERLGINPRTVHNVLRKSREGRDLL